MQLNVDISLSNLDIVISQLEECLSELHIWFCYNGLNLDKADDILLGTIERAKSLPLPPLSMSLASLFHCQNLWHNPQWQAFIKFPYRQPFKVMFLPCLCSSIDSSSVYRRRHQDHRMLIAWLPPELCQLHVHKKTLDSFIKSKPLWSHYTTMQMNRHHEDVERPTLASCQVSYRLHCGIAHIHSLTMLYSRVNHRTCH